MVTDYDFQVPPKQQKGIKLEEGCLGYLVSAAIFAAVLLAVGIYECIIRTISI